MFKDKYYVIDAHCHIYPEKIAERAVKSTGDFYDTPCVGGAGTTQDMLERGRAAGIDHFIVQSVATTPKQVGSINEFIASEVAASGGMFTGLGTLHPDSPDIAGDIAHLKSLGLKGVKLHPDIQQFKIDDYRCLKIYELLEGELPILMHTGDHRYDYSNPNRLLPVMQIFTGLTVIGAHLGGWSIFEQASRELAHLENLYVDCSSSLSYLTPEKAGGIIHRYGADKVIFGTDYPMWEMSSERDLFFKLPLDESEIESILSINAKKIFSLE